MRKHQFPAIVPTLDPIATSDSRRIGSWETCCCFRDVHDASARERQGNSSLQWSRRSGYSVRAMNMSKFVLKQLQHAFLCKAACIETILTQIRWKESAILWRIAAFRDSYYDRVLNAGGLTAVLSHFLSILYAKRLQAAVLLDSKHASLLKTKPDAIFSSIQRDSPKVCKWYRNNEDICAFLTQLIDITCRSQLSKLLFTSNFD